MMISKAKTKISVIIPSYNQGKFIEATICSIINQSYKNFELIIIDGGSSDETVQVIKKYEPFITYWVSEPDQGQAHAINKGLKVVTGDLFNWINSDDLLEPGALQAIAEYWEQNSSKNVICGFTRCFWDKDKSTSHEYRMGLKQSVAETIAAVEMNQPGTFYRTSLVKDLGGVNDSLRYVFDDELWFRYLCAYGKSAVGMIEQRLAQFRLHQDSKTIGEGYARFELELQSIYTELAISLGAPNWLLELIQAESQATYYRPETTWNLQYLEKENFIALFAAKYLNTLYLRGKKKEAKQAMKIVVENDHFRWNRMMTSLRLKLMFV